MKFIVYGGTDEFPCPTLGVTTILSFVLSIVNGNESAGIAPVNVFNVASAILIVAALPKLIFKKHPDISNI